MAYDVKTSVQPVGQVLDELKAKTWTKFSEELDDKWKEEQGAVILECSGKTFYAHRLLLEANSPFFLRMFNKSASHNKVDTKLAFEDMEPPTLQSILEFMYSKKVGSILNKQEFKNVLIASHLVELDALFDSCVDALVATLSNDLAEIGPQKALDNIKMKVILKFWLANAQELICGKQLLVLSFSQLRTILTALKGHVLDLDCLLGLLRWVRHDFEKRAKFSLPLLDCVDAKLTSKKWIVSLIEEQSKSTMFSDTRKKLRELCFVVSHADDFVTVKYPHIKSEVAGATTTLIFFGPHKTVNVLCADEKLRRITGYDYDWCLKQLNLATMEWLPSQKLSFCCCGVAICQYGRFLYMVGGRFINYGVYDVEKNALDQNECEEFKDWTGGGICVFKGYVFVIGGCIKKQKTTNVLYVKHGSKEWRGGSPLNSAVENPTVLATSKCIFVIGFHSVRRRLSIQYNSRPEKNKPWEILFIPSKQSVCQTSFFTQANTLQALYTDANDTVLLTLNQHKNQMEKKRFPGHPEGLNQIMRVCEWFSDELLQVYISTSDDYYRIPNFLWNSKNGSWIKLPSPNIASDLASACISLVFTI